MTNSIFNKDFPCIFECGSGIHRFQFVDLDRSGISDEIKEEVLDFVDDKPRPVFDDMQNVVYTWDYFKWLRHHNKRLKIKRSINEIGLGYCGACGMFNKMHNRNGKWECTFCGYKNIRLFDHNTRKIDEPV